MNDSDNQSIHRGIVSIDVSCLISMWNNWILDEHENAAHSSQHDRGDNIDRSKIMESIYPDLYVYLSM